MNRVYHIENTILGISGDFCVTVHCKSDRSHCRIDTAYLENLNGDFETATARVAWVNRTWESARFAAVVSNLFYSWVERKSGIKDFAKIRAIENKTYKTPAAEAARLAKVETIQNARSFWRALNDMFISGKGELCESRPQNETSDISEKVA